MERWIKRIEQYGVENLKSVRKRRATTAREDAAILTKISENRLRTAAQIREELQLKCCLDTIRSRIKEGGFGVSGMSIKYGTFEKKHCCRNLIDRGFSGINS